MPRLRATAGVFRGSKCMEVGNSSLEPGTSDGSSTSLVDALGSWNLTVFCVLGIWMWIEVVADNRCSQRRVAAVRVRSCSFELQFSLYRGVGSFALVAFHGRDPVATDDKCSRR
jgi:hypothetical protein